MSNGHSLSNITIISVSYNSAHILPEMLLSIPSEVPTIIVDNASEDVDILKQVVQASNAQLIQNKMNLGFGTACNEGAKYAKTEFLLFLNPDASLDEGALEALLEASEQYPLASAMNPRIILDNGAEFIRRNSILLDETEKLPKEWFPKTDHEVPILSGAALFVRRATFLAIGGFDTNIFLYHEDDDLAKRLRDEYGPLMHIHNALVRHMGDSSSTPHRATQTLKGWHTGFSRVYVTRKHQRPFARSRALWRAVMKLLNPSVLSSEQTRAYQIAYLKGVLRAMMS